MKIGDRVRVTATNEDLYNQGYVGKFRHGDVGVVTKTIVNTVKLNGETDSCWLKGVELHPYETQPIDYTGCHPVVAESLKRGEAITCLVRRASMSRCHGQRMIVAYIAGAYFSTHMESFLEAIPVDYLPERPKRLKSLKECLSLLIDNGYEMDCCGGWVKGQKCIAAKELLEYSELAYYEDFLLED